MPFAPTKQLNLFLFSNKALAFENEVTHNRGMKKLLTINARQLELLRDFTNFPVLQIFTEPSNPSEVAKNLKMPANSMHYRVNKLYEAGLLKLTEQKGRRRFYQSVAVNFRVRRELLQSAADSSIVTVSALAKVMQGYDKALSEYADKHVGDDNPYIHFGIENDGYRTISAYEPVMSLYEMPLSKADYEKLTRTLIEMVSSYKNGKPEEKHCTVAVVAFAKSSAFPSL
jgi:DNA-binding transcriptional ArsR family regulator